MVVLILALEFVSGGLVSGVVSRSASLVWSSLYRGAQNAEALGIFHSKEALVTENKHLQETVDALNAFAIENELLKSENEELKHLLNATGTPVARSQVVPVVSALGISPYTTFTLAAGSADGVAVGARVEGPGTMAVGAVVKVTEHTALVEPYIKGGQKIDVTIGNSAGVTLVGSGLGTGIVALPRGNTFATGTPVYLGTSQTVIGEVVHQESGDADALQRLFVALPFDPQALRFMRIVHTL